MKTLTEYIQKKQIAEVNYVDLDLPSGTKWAKMNIGAIEGDKPEDWYGLYFAWGETKGYKASDKHEFNWDNYNFGSENKLSKYNKEDKLTQLEKEDDAAYQITKGEFRMPTKEELEELYERTTHEWVKNYNNINGLNGRLFKSKIDKTKSIFIPASGYRDDIDNKSGNIFNIWSSIFNDKFPNYASFLVAESDYVILRNYAERYCGFTIRGILNK